MVDHVICARGVVVEIHPVASVGLDVGSEVVLCIEEALCHCGGNRWH